MWGDCLHRGFEPGPADSLLDVLTIIPMWHYGKSHIKWGGHIYKVPSENKINVTGKDMGALYCNGGEDVALHKTCLLKCANILTVRSVRI